ncbi:Sperm associated antigen 1, partial [Cladochytrium tenue]
SGKEGYYPQLEEAFEKRLEELDPRRINLKSAPRSSTELNSLGQEILDWSKTIKLTDRRLKDAEKEPSRIVGVRGAATQEPNRIQEQSNAIDFGSDHTSTESPSDGQSESDQGTSQTSSPSSRRKGIIKKSPSPDGEKKKVRFKDQVEAAEKAAETRRKRQEKRQHAAEAHQQAQAVKNKSRRARRRKPSGGAKEDDTNDVRGIEGVRSGETAFPTTKPVSSQDNSAPVRIKSTDYGAWDRLDVESELRKVDEETKVQTVGKTKIHSVPEIPIPTDVGSVPEDSREVEFLADMEKNKGNEAFKAGDYVEACAFYGRSLKLLERASTLTNRAITYIKLKKFSEAEEDCTRAIFLNDPKFNFKAFLRRASARSKRGRYAGAIADLNEALSISPESREAQVLLNEVTKKHQEVEGELPDQSRPKKNKLKVIEVDEDDDVEDEIVSPMVLLDRERARRSGAALKPVKTRSLKETTPPAEDAKPRVQGETPRAAVATVKTDATLGSIAVAAEPAKTTSGVAGSQVLTVVDVDEDDSECEDAAGPDPNAASIQQPDPPACGGIPMANDAANNVTETTNLPTECAGPTGDVPSGDRALETASGAVAADKTRLAARAKPAREAPVASTSYEFEGAWRTLRRDPAQWARYVRRHDPDRLQAVLVNVSSSGLLPDVVAALGQLADIDAAGASFAGRVLERLRTLPRVDVLVGLFSRSEKL